jgi:nitrile hydratase accessory protein
MQPTPFRSTCGSLILSAPDDEQNFAEPWQAQAYALVQALIESGLFSTSEWSEALGANLRKRPDDDGAFYYDAWLATLETLVIAKGAALPGDLANVKEAWRHAYETTPHGQPVELIART